MSARYYVELPLTLPSVANLREHWATRARRTKAQRSAIALLCGRELRAFAAEHPTASFAIELTRAAPRQLDSNDNNNIALKAVRDEVARQLGFTNDNDGALCWLYTQCKSPTPELRIKVDVVSEEARACTATR